MESRLPWWLVLLLGVWVAGLTLWSSSSAHRQIRWGAGLLTLVYLVLLFMALGGEPRVGSAIRGMAALPTAFLLGNAVALVAAVFLLGRPSSSGQLIWFIVLTVANAASCFAVGSAGVGAALLAMSFVVSIFALREVRRGLRPLWRECLPMSNSVAAQSVPASIGLMGVTGFALAILLVGTVAYVVRVETSRATASHRFSAIPSADRVHASLHTDAVRSTADAPFELAFGRRADVVVLLATLAFLALAMNQSTRVAAASELLASPSSPHGSAS